MALPDQFVEVVELVRWTYNKLSIRILMIKDKVEVDSELFEYLKTCPALECIQVKFSLVSFTRLESYVMALETS